MQIIKIIISEQKTISSLKGKSFLGKATTKYVIQLKTASLLVVCWGRMSEEIFQQIFFLISNTERGWAGVISNPVQNNFIPPMIISISYIHLQHTESPRYSLRIQGEFYVLLETGRIILTSQFCRHTGIQTHNCLCFGRTSVCKALTCVVSHVFQNTANESVNYQQQNKRICSKHCLKFLFFSFVANSKLVCPSYFGTLFLYSHMVTAEIILTGQ